MITAWLDRCEKSAAAVLDAADESSDYPGYLRLLPKGRPTNNVEDAAAILFRVRCIRQARLGCAVDDAIYNTALLIEHMRNLGVRELLPNARLGKERRQAQSERGKEGAAKRWAGNEAVTSVVNALAKWKDELGDPLDPMELWPILYQELDRLGLDPHEETDAKGKPIAYTFRDGRESYDAFRKAIQRARSRGT